MTQGTEVSPERIYLEAVRAAGPAENISEWRTKVDQIAEEINSGLKSFRFRLMAVANRIRLTGVVREAIENPTAESTGKELYLYKVIFASDQGKRPDMMWIDKRGGADLFAKVQSLVGQRAVIVKEQRVRFRGDDPELDAEGNPVTSPYLGSIEPEEENEFATTGAGEANGTKVTELLKLHPATASELAKLAEDHFGMSAAAIKSEVEKVIGPSERDASNKIKPRSKPQLKKAWDALVYAHADKAASAA